MYRFDPRIATQGRNPLQLDSRAPKIPLQGYTGMENRFQMLVKSHPERAAALLEQAQRAATNRYQQYEQRAQATAEVASDAEASADAKSDLEAGESDPKTARKPTPTSA